MVSFHASTFNVVEWTAIFELNCRQENILTHSLTPEKWKSPDFFHALQIYLCSFRPLLCRFAGSVNLSLGRPRFLTGERHNFGDRTGLNDLVIRTLPRRSATASPFL